MTTVIVTGSRNLTKWEPVFEVLDRLQPTHVVHGGCRGADMAAACWADRNAVACTVVPANWDKYGYSAGPERNKRMLRMYPDAEFVIGFPMGKSYGTRGCIKLAEQMGMSTLVYEQ